jgi:hypothetical protein
MGWGSLLSAFFKVLSNVSEYLSRRQLLEAGKDQATKESLESTLSNIDKATDVKKELSGNPDGKFSDSVRNKYTRSDE